jgi:hypothetical protein
MGTPCVDCVNVADPGGRSEGINGLREAPRGGNLDQWSDRLIHPPSLILLTLVKPQSGSWLTVRLSRNTAQLSGHESDKETGVKREIILGHLLDTTDDVIATQAIQEQRERCGSTVLPTLLKRCLARRAIC